MHSNKRGVRYRYYVSHALLQNRKEAAGSVARVSAPEIKAMVVAALRERSGQGRGEAAGSEAGTPIEAAAPTDHELIERRLARISVRTDRIELLVHDGAGKGSSSDNGGGGHEVDLGSAAGVFGQEPSGECEEGGPRLVSLPFTAPSFTAAKGILHAPAELRGKIPPHARDALLRAIVKARRWVDELAKGRASFEEIAIREGKVEHHIRALAPLAFVSPRIIAAIQDGTAPAGLTIT